MPQFISGQVEQSPGERIKGFFKNLSSKRTLNLLGILFIVLALPVTIYFSMQQQAYQQRAASSNQCPSIALENIGAIHGIKQNLEEKKSQILLSNITLALYVKITKNGKLNVQVTDQDKLYKLFAIRKQFFINTIRTKPEEAIKNTFSDKNLLTLQQFINCVETKQSIEGRLEILHSDDFKKKISNTFYYLVTDTKERVQLHFTKELKKSLISSMRIKVTGYKIDHEMLIDISTPNIHNNKIEIVTNLPKKSSFNLFNTKVQADIPDSMGEQKTVTLLTNFQNTSQPSITKDQIADIVFNQVNSYYKENSYGKTYITGDIYPPKTTSNWYTLPIDQTCDYNPVLTEAIKIADADVDFTHYDRLVIYVPFGGEGRCASGWGTVGKILLSTADGDVAISIAWVMPPGGDKDIRTTAHEYGHNLGLDHANFLYCADKVVAESNCFHQEYGDNYDVMGSAESGHFNDPHKEYLGWFNSSNTLVPNKSSTYTIEPIEATTNGIKEIKLPRSNDAYFDNDFLTLEYRQSIGFDQTLGTYTNVFKGILLHIGTSKPYILDTSPPGHSGSDVALAVGQSFTDPLTGTKITTTNIDSSGATVDIVLGKTDFTPPTVSIISPTNNDTVSGTVTVTADATDDSGIEKVEFYNSYKLIGTATTTPYAISWDTTHVSNGDNYLYAIAYDKAGEVGHVPDNQGYSNVVDLIVYNIDNISPSGVKITSPTNGAIITNPVTVSVDATDNVGIYGILCYKDDDSYPFSVTTTNTCENSGYTSFSIGTHTVYAVAYDYVLNSTTSESISITIAPNKISWKTQQASLEADDFSIVFNGKTYYANTNVSLYSINVDPTKFTNLEASWQEQGIPLKLVIYFNNKTPYWTVSQVDFHYMDQLKSFTGFSGIKSLLGQFYTIDSLVFNGYDDELNTISFTSLKLGAFLDQPVPTPTFTPTPTPTEKLLILKAKTRLAVSPRPTKPVTPTPTSILTPTPSPNKISWHAYNAQLDADNFYLVLHGRKYLANPNTVNVSSEKQSDYIKFEIRWHENDADILMRIWLTKIYNSSQWNTSWETYENGERKDYWDETITADIGKPFTTDSLVLTNYDKTGEIHFENLKLQPFF